jgi:hypothetical protein
MKQLLGFLLLVGLALTYWQWLLALVVLVLIVKAAPIAWRELQDERAASAQRRAELTARADQQAAWFVAGDPRWVTGHYPPAVGG